jgi:hypothetical protein
MAFNENTRVKIPSTHLSIRIQLFAINRCQPEQKLKYIHR